jgi:hypothetical protein
VTAAFSVLFSPAAVAAETDRIALVIGNGKYVHTARLTNPANDARALSRTLRVVGLKRCNLQTLTVHLWKANSATS